MLRFRTTIFSPVWQYRHFILSSIRTEFKTRFIRSKLGAFWMVMQPLAMVLIYALILSQIMTAKLPGAETRYAYPIHILSGVICWNVFLEIMTRNLNVFVENGELIKKLNFPKITLPIIIAGSAIVNFCLMFVLTYIVFGFLGHFPVKSILWVIPLFIITLTLASGIGMFFGILNVFLRDVGQLVNIVVQFWFWLTPIVYTMNIIPEQYAWLMSINPLTPLVIGFNDVLLYNKPPVVSELAYPCIIAFIFVFLSIFIYPKASKEMADVL